MKTSSITNYNNYSPTFKSSSNYSPTFKESLVVAYPEYRQNYRDSYVNANNSDGVKEGAVVALLNKFAKAYRLLFTPEIDKTSNDIKNGINTLFDNEQAVKFNKIA